MIVCAEVGKWMLEWGAAWVAELGSLEMLRLTKQYFGMKVREIVSANDQELANALQRAQMMGSFMVRQGQNDASAAE